MILKEEDLPLIQSILGSMRKGRPNGPKRDAQDISDVLAALRACGFVVIQKGAVDAMRELLKKL